MSLDLSRIVPEGADTKVQPLFLFSLSVLALGFTCASIVGTNEPKRAGADVAEACQKLLQTRGKPCFDGEGSGKPDYIGDRICLKPAKDIDLTSFFDGIRPKQVRVRNASDALCRDWLVFYLDRLVPCLDDVLGLGLDTSPLRFFSDLRNQLKGLSDSVEPLLSACLRNFFFKTNDTDGSEKILEFTINDGRKTSNDGRNIQHSIDELRALLQHWFDQRYLMHDQKPSEDTVYIPGLPGLSLGHGMAWLRHLVGFVQPENADAELSGAFLIVRQSRGAVTNDPADTDLLLRDLLWLRPIDRRHSSQALLADHLSDAGPGQHGSPLGFYYSIKDEWIFEIRKIELQDGTLLLDALALRDERPNPRSLSLMLPAFEDHSIKARIGTLMGATGKTERSGSWIVLARQKNSTGSTLDRALASYLDDLSEMTRLQYDHSISGLRQFLEGVNLAGVLSSKILLSSGSPEQMGRAGAFKDAFRALFRTSGTHRANVERVAGDLLQPIQRLDPKSQPQELTRLIGSLLEEQQMHAISPVSTRSEPKEPRDRDEFKRTVFHLAERPAIFRSYSAYKDWLQSEMDRPTEVALDTDEPPEAGQ